MVICMGFRYTLFVLTMSRSQFFYVLLISHSKKKNKRQTGQIYRIKKIGIERFDAEYNYRRKDECAETKR